MSNHRLRIFSSLLLAFIIVNIYANFSGIKDALADFKFPNFNVKKLFSLNFDVPNNETMIQLNNQDDVSVDFVQTSPVPTQIPTDVQTQNFASLPTPIEYIFPTTIIKGSGNPTPTKTGLINQTPTKYIKPPKPTKVPPAPPITSDLRPGSTLMEVFQEVSRRMCFPAALLMAFQTEETGAWFKINEPASKIKIYNTYGWWKTGAGNPCTGFGYHTQTGIVPSDSVGAGTRCRNAVGSTNDIGIMGIFQISQEEETVSRKNTKSTLPNNIDRRVLFDNALIFASITKNRAGTVPKDCNNWPDDVIKTVAEKHQGVCRANYGNGNNVDYCADILRLYKQYK